MLYFLSLFSRCCNFSLLLILFFISSCSVLLPLLLHIHNNYMCAAYVHLIILFYSRFYEIFSFFNFYNCMQTMLSVVIIDLIIYLTKMCQSSVHCDRYICYQLHVPMLLRSNIDNILYNRLNHSHKVIILRQAFISVQFTLLISPFTPINYR